MGNGSFKSQIEAFALRQLDVDACKFTTPFLTQELNEYREWVSANRLGDMQYLARHLPFKEDPNLLLPGVQSAIVVIKNYKNTGESSLKQPYKIARYAVGQDYHTTMVEALEKLAQYVKQLIPGCDTYVGVDSRPIPERSLAIKAGIGFRGRNTMVIRPKLGSYFLIGVMYTTAKFESDSPLNGSCGTCMRCVEACPTQAISADGKLTATACISYQTIEHKTPLTSLELAETKGWVFGCDICQEVCPFNHGHTPLTSWESLKPESGVGFDFFNTNSLLEENQIPKHTVLYRSRKRVAQNLRALKNGLP